MRHRISAGTLTIRDGAILLVRHYRAGVHDFWCAPGGGVEADEELSAAAERETFEETGLVVRATTLAYIEDLVDSTGRSIKFWFLAEPISGQIDVSHNPAQGEAIVAAGWFDRSALPQGHLFPEIIGDRLWTDRERGFAAPVKLPLRRALF